MGKERNGSLITELCLPLWNFELLLKTEDKLLLKLEIQLVSTRQTSSSMTFFSEIKDFLPLLQFNAYNEILLIISALIVIVFVYGLVTISHIYNIYVALWLFSCCTIPAYTCMRVPKFWNEYCLLIECKFYF